MQKEKLEMLRHSLAHVMAASVSELYPGVKLAIGPSTDDGFYYDFDFGTSSTDLKSYVYRSFSFTQEIDARLTNRTGIFFSTKIELEENGKLDWDRWTEFLLMNRETFWFRTSLSFQTKKQLFIVREWAIPY